MAKSKKAMSKSLKSTGDAWRAHVANVAKTEGVKYGKAMSLASKGKYGAEWKKIKAGMGSNKKGGMTMSPANYNQYAGDPDPYNEKNQGPASVGGGDTFPNDENEMPAQAGGRRKRTRRTKKNTRSKRGGILPL